MHKHRYTIDLSPRADQALQGILDLSSHQTKADILRRALEVYWEIAKAMQDGAKLCLRDSSGQVTELWLVELYQGEQP